MNDESMPMPVGSKTRKVCGGCGHRAGQHYPSGCIALVSSSARCGCLIPASDGSATQVDPVAAGRGLDLLALMDERAASAVSPVLAAVLDEAERLRARVAELAVTAGQNEESTTGYVVIALEVASAYDPETDE
jgi:hypothetical protein